MKFNLCIITSSPGDVNHYEINHEKPDMFRYGVEKELIKNEDF